MNRKLKEITNKLQNDDVAEQSVKDEDRCAELMMKHGSDFIATYHENKFERWDVEGTDCDGNDVKIELKSRFDTQHDQSQFSTWIIDSYKLDYLATNFPDDVLYYCNAYKGEYHLYSVDWIRSQGKETKWATLNGKKQKREWYSFPKDYFIIELESGQKGPGWKRFKLTEHGKK